VLYCCCTLNMFCCFSFHLTIKHVFRLIMHFLLAVHHKTKYIQLPVQSWCDRPSLHRETKLGLCHLPFTNMSSITFYYCLQCFVTVGRQEEHSACKNRVMGCLCCYLSGARCRFLHMVKLMPLPPQNPIISCLI